MASATTRPLEFTGSIDRLLSPDFSQEKLDLLESYMTAVKLFRSYEDPSEDPLYSEVPQLTAGLLIVKIGILCVVFFTSKVELNWFPFEQVIEINLSSMVPQVSGPKRPQDRVAVSGMKEDFQSCLDEKVLPSLTPPTAARPPL